MRFDEVIKKEDLTTENLDAVKADLARLRNGVAASCAGDLS